MIRLQFLMAIAFFPVLAFAQSEGSPYGWVYPEPEQGKKLELKYGDEITVKGENLHGKYDIEQGHPPKKEICLVSAYSDSDRICIPHDDSRINRWTNNMISLDIPEDIYPEVKVTLRYQEYEEECDKLRRGGLICDNQWNWQKDIEAGGFFVESVVESVEDKNGNLVKALSKGNSYIIKGKYFGQSQGRVFVNGSEIARSDVVKWFHDSAEINLTSAAGNTIEIDNGNGRASFDLTSQKDSMTSSSSSVSGNADPSIFNDVKSSHPYLPAVEWGKSSGVLNGYPDGTFRPNNPVNRAEFLKIIIEADPSALVSANAGNIGFPDVDSQAWFAPYVRYAKDNGIIEGYPDGTFRPEKTVNFAEALKIAYEALGVNTEDIGGEWYAKYLAHAKYNEALFSNKVDVGSEMTRKDVVWLVWRLVNN